MRGVIVCPECHKIFVNRIHKSCPKCKIGLKFAGEFVYEGDWYWDKGIWITYEELGKRAKEVAY